MDTGVVSAVIRAVIKVLMACVLFEAKIESASSTRRYFPIWSIKNKLGMVERLKTDKQKTIENSRLSEDTQNGNRN